MSFTRNTADYMARNTASLEFVGAGDAGACKAALNDIMLPPETNRFASLGIDIAAVKPSTKIALTGDQLTAPLAGNATSQNTTRSI